VDSLGFVEEELLKIVLWRWRIRVRRGAIGLDMQIDKSSEMLR
jgi:hypothetical protein